MCTHPLTCTEGNELFRLVQLSVRADKPLRAEVFRVTPDVGVLQDGIHKRHDDGVLWDDIAAESDVIRRGMLHGEGSDAAFSKNFVDSGLQVNHINPVPDRG